MKKYLTRLRLALCNRPYLQDRMELETPLVRGLDEFILDLVKVNLPRYTTWHPMGMTEESRNEIRNRMVQLATEIQEYEMSRGWRYQAGLLESKVWFSVEEVQVKRQEFLDLLYDHFRNLRD